MAEIRAETPEGKDIMLDTFSTDELTRFEEYWYSVTQLLNKEGYSPVFTDVDKQALLQVLQAYKRDHEGSPEFMGANPKTGFGVRLNLPEDVGSRTAALGTNATALQSWEVTWGTAGDRNWLSDNIPDNGTFAAAGTVQLRDDAQVKWAWIFFGIASMHPSPKAKSILLEIDTFPQVRQHCEFHLRQTDMKIFKFQHPFYFPITTSYKIGLEIRNTGAEVVFPLGFAIIDKTRALQVAVKGPIAG